MTAVSLFPQPQYVEWRGGTAPSGTEVVEQSAAGLPSQGFTIDIDDHAVVLTYGDDAGRRYGRATLDQLRGQDAWPAVSIRDWPDFAVRGYMLDISRDRVPTRATLERLVGLMAVARINHFELYTEHTFAYAEHEAVWREASPMTPADIAWLDERCAAAGIELVPNQNCFGHMDRWLRHDAYRWRAETPDGYEMAPGRMRPPGVLAPNEENAAFAHGLFAELLPNFRSRTVHIGCDETFELGLGASRAAVAERGKAAVFAEHLARLANPLVSEGRLVLFWDDIIRSDPSVVSRVADEATAVAWLYEGPQGDGEIPRVPESIAEVLSTLGIDVSAEGGFRRIIEPLAATGRPFWVAPGTSSWNSLIGRVDNAMANLLDAAVAGREWGSSGYLITDWGDGGHLQPPSVSFGPMLYGGAVSWCAAANRDIDLASVLDRYAFEGPLGSTVVALGRMWSRTGQPCFNGSPLDAALGRGSTSFVGGDPDAVGLASIVEELDGVIDRLPSITLGCEDALLVLHELETAARLARHGAWRLAGRAGVIAPPVDVLRADLADVIDQQRRTWMTRSRPGGLSDSIARLERVLERYSAT